MRPRPPRRWGTGCASRPRWRGRDRWPAPLLVLEDDPLEDDGHVLPGVGGRLEGLDDLLGLDDEDRVAAGVEDARHRLAVEAIPFLLELVDPLAVLQNRVGIAQVDDRLPDLL